MVTKEQIARINELAKKKKAEGLTAEEQAEQKVLYRAYIDAFKANLRAQLENIEIIDEDKQEVEKIEEEVEALEEINSNNRGSSRKIYDIKQDLGRENDKFLVLVFIYCSYQLKRGKSRH